MSKSLLPKTERLLYFVTSSLAALGSLAIHFSRDLGCFFGEDSSALTDVFSGDVQVYLDHEDLRA
jgi:hypothetical protein